MEQQYLEELLKLAPLGYAYHKLILNSLGEPEDYIFLEINPAFEAMTGVKRESVLRKRMTEALPGVKSDSFDWVAFYGKVAMQGTVEEFTQYSEALKRWYKITAYSPEKQYFITFVEDITAQMNNLQELKRREADLEALSVSWETIFNSTHDAMFLVGVEDGVFRYFKCNTVYQKLTGFSSAELEGRTPIELAGEETGALWVSNYQKCMDARETIFYEETLKLPGGERVWQITLTPVLENEQVTYLIGSQKDVTLQKKAESERNALLLRFQTMMTEHTAVMLLIEPVTGQIVDANPAACAFYGYTKETLLSMSIHDINMLGKAEVSKLLSAVATEKKEYHLFPHRLKSGEIRTVDVYSSPITVSGETLLFSIIFDVTDRERQREELYREKELLRTTLYSIGDGVVTTDSDGRITDMNKVAQDLTCWGYREAKNRPFSDVFKLKSEVTGIEVENPIAQVLQTGGIVGLANHTVLQNKCGQVIPITDSAAPIKDKEGNTFGVVMVFQDVSKEKEQQDQIRFLSYHDHLTGLYNRRFMEEEILRLDTPRQLPLAVIMGDVNGLKLTNDVFGHQSGDLLLKKVAGLITENCRQEDIVARWGGDEFLILLPQTTFEQAEKIIQRIKASCAEQCDASIHVSVSLGCGVKTKEDENLLLILKEAEEWMYHQKLLDGKSYRNTIINTLLSTLFEKNMETEEHAERLREYCHAVGRARNFSDMELDELSLLAILHDIGKVGINESILQKPTSLTPKEWEEVKTHPEIGYRIAQNTPELSAVAEYILSHHERWDGKGYPRGLSGEKIPLLSRILTVADSYDAMTSDRVYRKAISKEAALEEIKKNAGTQFDPEVADIFVHLLTPDPL